MNELIQKLMDETGISAEQTTKVLDTIKGYVKEKFPMMGGAVDKLFEGGSAGGEAPDMHAGGLLGGLSDFI